MATARRFRLSDTTAFSSGGNQDFALADIGQVAMVAPNKAIRLNGRLYSKLLEPLNQHPEKDRRVGAIVGKGRQQFNGPPAKDGSFLHARACPDACLAEETDRPVGHHGAQEVLGIPLDDDKASSHIGAHFMPDVTPDDDDPALHTVLASPIGGPDTVPGIALDSDQPALHFDAQEVIG